MKSKDEAVVRSSISLQIDKFLIDKKRDIIIASKSMLIVFHSQNSPFFILQYSSRFFKSGFNALFSLSLSVPCF